MEKTKLRKATYLRRDKGDPSRNLALLDPVSDIVLILRADVSTDELDWRPEMHVHDTLKHGRYCGSWQLMQT